MPGAFRYIARVPRGLPGPGGIDAGSPAPHPVGAGLIHVGFFTLLTTCQVPTGVVNPGMAVATGKVRCTLNPSYRKRRFCDRSITIVLPSEESVARGWTFCTGSLTFDPWV